MLFQRVEGRFERGEVGWRGGGWGRGDWLGGGERWG